MGILRRITEAKTSAELVLSSRSDDDSVDHWRMPGQVGVSVTLFLQFHTADDQPLQGKSARVRFAVRNHYPQTFTFTRELDCQGGTLGSNASKTALRIRAARADEVKQVLLQDVVPFQRDPGSDGAEIEARIQFTEPQSLSHIADTLTVMSLPAAQRRCPCCLRSFPS